MALSYFLSFEVPVSIIRPFKFDMDHVLARAVIPMAFRHLGVTDIKLGSLSPTRDFNYVSDTASGFVCALKSDESVGEVINIGSGFEISVRDTVELIANLMNVKINIESDESRVRPENSEVERLCACNKKLLS